MSQTSTSAKVCIHCARDCANRPRLRDQLGKYHCKECVARLNLAHRPAASVAAARELPDDGPIPLMEEPDEPAIRADICQGCRAPISPEAAVCVKCGFNRATGDHVDTTIEVSKELKKKSKPRSCRECGADMTGLAAPRCPECGTAALDDRINREERQQEEFRRLARLAWWKPIAISVPAVGLLCLIVAVRSGPSFIPAVLLWFAIQLTIGAVIYVVSTFMWIGVDRPLPQTLLSLIAPMALYFCAYILVLQLGIGTLAITMLVLPTVLYAGLLCWAMDIEVLDGMIVAGVTSAVIFGVRLALAG